MYQICHVQHNAGEGAWEEGRLKRLIDDISDSHVRGLSCEFYKKFHEVLEFHQPKKEKPNKKPGGKW